MSGHGGKLGAGTAIADGIDGAVSGGGGYVEFDPEGVAVGSLLLG